MYSTRTSVRKICIGSHHTSDDLLFSDTHLQGSIAQVEVDATQGCVYHTEISDYAGKIQVISRYYLLNFFGFVVNVLLGTDHNDRWPKASISFDD